MFDRKLIRPFLGYSLFVGTVAELKAQLKAVARKKVIINTLNPHSYVVAKKDLAFSSALKGSDLLVADGAGTVLGIKHTHNIDIHRIAGFDVFRMLMTQANELNQKVFFLGASQETLDAIASKVSQEFPNARVASFSPPFAVNFTEADNLLMKQAVNSFAPDFLFIGMTAPKQEKWLNANKDELNFKVASCIGAVFDFYAGNVIRPSIIWQKLSLEWFVRLIAEPKRLWRRTFISAPIFIWDVFFK